MNRLEQKKVMKNLMYLRGAIQEDVDIIADKLYECGIFDFESKQAIVNASHLGTNNKQVKCGILINKLLRSGKEAYGSFKMVLEDLGHHAVIQMMETTTFRDATDTKTSWIEDKEKTFIKSAPMLNSDRHLDGSLLENNVKWEACTNETVDDIQQLNKMMTFVLTKIDNKDINYQTGKVNNHIKDILIDEGSGATSELRQPLNHKGYYITSQSLAH